MELTISFWYVGVHCHVAEGRTFIHLACKNNVLRYIKDDNSILMNSNRMKN